MSVKMKMVMKIKCGDNWFNISIGFLYNIFYQILKFYIIQIIALEKSQIKWVFFNVIFQK